MLGREVTPEDCSRHVVHWWQTIGTQWLFASLVQWWDKPSVWIGEACLPLAGDDRWTCPVGLEQSGPVCCSRVCPGCSPDRRRCFWISFWCWRTRSSRMSSARSTFQHTIIIMIIYDDDKKLRRAELLMRLCLRATEGHLTIWNHTVLPATQHKWTHSP